ncbi:hypothetical protein D3C76_854630 [compost metagenome]
MLSAYQANTPAAPGTSMFQASVTGLPMFSESSSASSSRLAIISSLSLSSTALRSRGAMRAQGPLSKAWRAERTAASISAAPQAATLASRRLVAGSMEAKVAPSAAATRRPSIRALSMKV